MMFRGAGEFGRARGGVMADGVQWQVGEVGVDGWESGPLSQSEKAARACGSRHAYDTKGESRVCSEGEDEGSGQREERSVLQQHTWTADVWARRG